VAVKQVDPRRAYELQSRSSYTYLDVRTVGEFTAGHAEGAVNAPIFRRDPATGQMLPNPDFLVVVEAAFPKVSKLVVGCGSGSRSQHACEILERAGYKELLNIQGGFSGLRDPLGQIIQPGWLQLGLPISQASGPGASYEALKAKAQEGK